MRQLGSAADSAPPGGYGRTSPGRNEVRDPQHGKLVYQRYCVSCHGRNGDGSGDAADQLSPRPRISGRDIQMALDGIRVPATVEDIDRTSRKESTGR